MLRKLNGLLNKAELFIKRNSSTILTCVGAAGVIATSIMAVKATPKAMRKLEEAKDEKGMDLTKTEKFVVAGPAYIPAAIAGASTIACIFGANILNKRHQAALMSAYALLDNSFKDYKKKTEELYGEDAPSRIREEMAKDKYEETEVGDDKILFYDDFSGRYFESTMETVIKAEYEINRKISLWGGAVLNEFYDLLGIEPTDYGNFLGWSDGALMDMGWTSWLDFHNEKVVMDDGLECYIISMAYEPMYDYEYY